MDRLEKIVRKMESGNLALEEIISYYEQGIQLKKICERLLSQAEQRVAALEENADGDPVLRDVKISPSLGVQPSPEKSPKNS